MRARSNLYRGPGAATMLLLALGMVLVGGGGVFGALVGLGYIDLNSAQPVRAAPIDRTGQVAFPALARSVKAYAAIAREDLLDPKTGRLHVMWLREADVRPEMIRDLSDIVGRVVSRDKRPDMVLTEADFFTKGTRPGVVAGIPPGRRALIVPGGAITGLHLLRRGDRFDLLASVPVRTSDEAPLTLQMAALSGGVERRDTAIGDLERTSGVQLLVRAGLLVTDGAAQGDVTVAIDPEEVAPLTAALAARRSMYCVVRSGRPDDPGDEPLASPSFEGMIALPAAARSLPRYTQVREEHLADPTTGQLKLFYFDPATVDPQWVVDPRRILGRVLAHDLGAGYLFRESDFLPAGTREGVAGGTPPGKLAVEVDARKIAGLAALRSGDRFDLLATTPVDLRRSLPQLRFGLGREPIDGADQLLHDLERRATISVLVENAAVVTADGDRLTLAVEPTEVAPLTKALSLGSAIYCVARSGRPDNDATIRIVPDRSPVEDLAVIERIEGRRRALEVFATSPPEAPPVSEPATLPAGVATPLRP